YRSERGPRHPRPPPPAPLPRKSRFARPPRSAPHPPPACRLPSCTPPFGLTAAILPPVYIVPPPGKRATGTVPPPLLQPDAPAGAGVLVQSSPSLSPRPARR